MDIRKVKDVDSLCVKASFVALAACLSYSSGLQALPQGGVVEAGNAILLENPEADLLYVDQLSQKTIINWDSFNIGEGEQVYFNQQGDYVALNRVVGGDPSAILGQLSGAGRIFLINPNGILFGESAVVDVGSLVASTLDITNEDFLAGNYNFSGDADSTAMIINNGLIKANGSVGERGLAALVAPGIENHGFIQAQTGSIVLASGASVSTVDLFGDGLLNLSIDAAPTAAPRNGDDVAVDQAILNSETGVLLADGGRILVSASAAESLVDNAINMQGVAQALSVNNVDGSITLVATGSAGVVVDNAVLNTGGEGDVNITAESDIRLDNAALSAAESSVSAGNDLNIGGEYLDARSGIDGNKLILAAAQVSDDGQLVSTVPILIQNGDIDFEAAVIDLDDYVSNGTGDMTLTATGADGDGKAVSMGAVDTSGAVTVNAENGDVVFDSQLGTNEAPIGSLTVDSGGSVELPAMFVDGAVSSTALINYINGQIVAGDDVTIGGGDVYLGGDIFSGGDIILGKAGAFVYVMGNGEAPDEDTYTATKSGNYDADASRPVTITKSVDVKKYFVRLSSNNDGTRGNINILGSVRENPEDPNAEFWDRRPVFSGKPPDITVTGYESQVTATCIGTGCPSNYNYTATDSLNVYGLQVDAANVEFGGAVGLMGFSTPTLFRPAGRISLDIAPPDTAVQTVSGDKTLVTFGSTAAIWNESAVAKLDNPNIPVSDLLDNALIVNNSRLDIGLIDFFFTEFQAPPPPPSGGGPRVPEKPRGSFTPTERAAPPESGGGVPDFGGPSAGGGIVFADVGPGDFGSVDGTDASVDTPVRPISAAGDRESAATQSEANSRNTEAEEGVLPDTVVEEETTCLSGGSGVAVDANMGMYSGVYGTSIDSSGEERQVVCSDSA